jgi:hypothetical protein
MVKAKQKLPEEEAADAEDARPQHGARRVVMSTMSSSIGSSRITHGIFACMQLLCAWAAGS